MSPAIERRSDVPVLVLGTGVTALGAIRILARDGIRAYVAESADDVLLRSRWYEQSPSKRAGVDWSDLPQSLEALDLGSAVLMPCSDSSVTQVARLSASLRERFPASIATEATIARLVDKGLFAALLEETGIPCPLSKMVSSADDLATVPDAVLKGAILKPRDSQRFVARFRVKAFHVRSRQEAEEHLRLLSAEGFPVILQEYIPGPATNHFFVDGFIDRFGTMRAAFVRQRLRMYPFDFGNSTAMVSVPTSAAPAAVASIEQLLQHVNYRGIFSAEFKLDSRDNTFKLLEVNARPWWYVDFAARCGVDVCKMAYDDALERPVETVAAYSVGRTLVFPAYDYFACRELRQRGELSAFGWARSWLTSVQPVFQLNDPAPGIRGLCHILLRWGHGRLRRIARL